MSNIYNSYTKRWVNGVTWAKKGKFWYKKGSKAKYYPRNGWSTKRSNGRRRRSGYGTRNSYGRYRRGGY